MDSADAGRLQQMAVLVRRDPCLGMRALPVVSGRRTDKTDRGQVVKRCESQKTSMKSVCRRLVVSRRGISAVEVAWEASRMRVPSCSPNG